jgi:hypothetical protein
MESEKPLYRLMREWLDAIPAEDRAAPETYRARLAACRACGELANGLCRQCGCYVELRAAKKKSVCPGAPPRWR